MMLSKSVRAILLIGALSMAFLGCSHGVDQDATEEVEIVAEIDNYKMSITDYKDRVDFLLTSKYLAVEPNEAKEELLDELIVKNVLLQEAQDRDLDKQKPFMREIERYWGQSLIKLLLKRRSEELSEGIVIDDTEVNSVYQKMKRRILARLIMLSSQQAAQKLAKSTIDSLEAVMAELEAQVISGRQAEWWTLGDLPPVLEDQLFALEPGKISLPIKFDNSWVVIGVLQEEEADLKPFAKIAPMIKSDLLKQKINIQLEAWIKDLKEDVSVTINDSVLQAIDLQ